MPTYDYQCPDCRHKFSLFQSMKDKPIKVCPKCGKRKVEKLIGAGAGILFKGSGFYVTDYRKDSYKAAAKKDKDGSSTAKSSKKDSSKAGSGSGKSSD